MPCACNSRQKSATPLTFVFSRITLKSMETTNTKGKGGAGRGRGPRNMDGARGRSPVVQICLPLALRAKLQERADLKKMTISECARQIVEDSLKEDNE